jgi:hypothetical protein
MGGVRFLCHGDTGSALSNRGLECGLLSTIGMRFSLLDGAVVAYGGGLVFCLLGTIGTRFSPGGGRVA